MQPALNAVEVWYTEGLLSPRPLSPTLTLINHDPIPNSNPILWDSGPPVADPGMGGPGGRPLPPPLTKTYGWTAGLGCTKQSASDTGASFHLNPELLVTIFVRKLTKIFQFQGVGAVSPSSPTRGSALRPRWGLYPQTANPRFGSSLWQILDPPLRTATT